MAAVKYPIPTNYVVTEMNGLQGLIRKDKRGDKWLWEPFYRFICVGKSYGKILVAYLPAVGGFGESKDVADHLRIASYNQKEHINARVYDFLFGENFLYIKTDHGSNVEWCLVSQDLTGGKFIGNFEIANRGEGIKFHVPIGTNELKIIVKDTKTGEDVHKILKLTSGEIIDEVKESKVKNKPIEIPITHYNLVVGADGSKIKLLNSDTKAVVKESQAIGEVEQYISILEMMLGGLERIPKEIGDKLINFTRKFEVMVHGTVIPVLYEYVKSRNPNFNVEQIIDGMTAELDTGWSKSLDGKQFKVYIDGPIVVVLMQIKNGLIHVAPHIIKDDDSMIPEESIEAIDGCYNENAVQSVCLSELHSQLGATVTDEKQLKHWPLPYSVNQRTNFQQTIGKYTYKKLEVYQLKGKIVSDIGNEHGELSLVVVSCEDLRYKPKASITKGQNPAWVDTNIVGIQLV